MIKGIGVALGVLLVGGLFVAGWTAVRSIWAGTSFLRTGSFTLFSETEPLKVVAISCQSCAQRTIRNRFTSTAESLEATYRDEQAGTLYLRFASGTAQVRSKTLEPGCHEITLETGGSVEVSAKRVEIAFPRGEKSCPTPTETSLLQVIRQPLS